MTFGGPPLPAVTAYAQSPSEHSARLSQDPRFTWKLKGRSRLERPTSTSLTFFKETTCLPDIKLKRRLKVPCVQVTMYPCSPTCFTLHVRAASSSSRLRSGPCVTVHTWVDPARPCGWNLACFRSLAIMSKLQWTTRFRRGHVYLHGPRVRFRVRGEMNMSFKKKKKSPRFSPEGLRQFAFVLLMDKVSPYPPCLVIGVWNLWIVG